METRNPFIAYLKARSQAQHKTSEQAFGEFLEAYALQRPFQWSKTEIYTHHDHPDSFDWARKVDKDAYIDQFNRDLENLNHFIHETISFPFRIQDQDENTVKQLTLYFRDLTNSLRQALHELNIDLDDKVIDGLARGYIFSLNTELINPMEEEAVKFGNEHPDERNILADEIAQLVKFFSIIRDNLFAENYQKKYQDSLRNDSKNMKNKFEMHIFSRLYKENPTKGLDYLEAIKTSDLQGLFISLDSQKLKHNKDILSKLCEIAYTKIHDSKERESYLSTLKFHALNKGVNEIEKIEKEEKKKSKSMKKEKKKKVKQLAKREKELAKLNKKAEKALFLKEKKEEPQETVSKSHKKLRRLSTMFESTSDKKNRTKSESDNHPAPGSSGFFKSQDTIKKNEESEQKSRKKGPGKGQR